MKVDIDTLRDTFKISYDAFESSRIEAMEVYDLYHNRQYTDQQLTILENRGQPKETFNVIKWMSRLLLGYYSTVVNEVKVNPEQEDDIIKAAVMNDVVSYTFKDNNFNAEGDAIKLDCMLSGMMCSYIDVLATGDTDKFGRPKYRIKMHHIPILEIAPDPMSTLEDYSDAKYIHRFKWLSEEDVKAQWGEAKLKELDAYDNHLNIDEAEFEYSYNGQFTGYYKTYDNYLIVHTIMEDDNGRSWSVYWSGDTILSKKEMTFRKVKSHYRIHKLHTSNRAEYYGIFREVTETQHAINQALIKIQLLVNTKMAFVEEGSVENLADFKDAFNRVNAVIEVKDLQGIKIESLSKEIVDQYEIINNALNRIQRLLSINDSFLGMAYASDSGAKVKLQQNASMVALRYMTAKIEQFYNLLGWDIVNLVTQYYTANDMFRIADSYEGFRWVEINKPVEVPTGRVDPQTGVPETQTVFEEVLDPDNNEPIVNDKGEIVLAPIPTLDTDIAFTKADIEIASVSYNDEDEKNQMLLEQVLNGSAGQILSQVNPAGYFKMSSLAIRNTKSKYSLEISKIFEDTANMLNPQQQQAMMEGQMEGQMSPEQAANQISGRPATGGE